MTAEERLGAAILAACWRAEICRRMAVWARARGLTARQAQSLLRALRDLGLHLVFMVGASGAEGAHLRLRARDGLGLAALRAWTEREGCAS